MHPVWRASAVLFASALLLPTTPARAVPGDESSGLERARRILESLASTGSARWDMRSWERKGEKTQELAARCIWSAQHGMKIELLEGRGSGARIRVDGDRVSVKPPGVFGFVRMRYSIDDGAVRSLRGRTLRSAPIAERAREVLAWLGRATLTIVGRGDLVLETRNDAGQPEYRAVLEGDGEHVAFRIEGFAEGELVERAEYRDVELQAPVSESDLKF